MSACVLVELFLQAHFGFGYTTQLCPVCVLIKISEFKFNGEDECHDLKRCQS
jgi:hypothetical protein